jgi:hypothetical protein
MSGTPRLGLPFLSAGQAQKEFTHNEALQTLDIVAAPAVEQTPLDDPPASPAVGSCYIVGDSPTGTWAGKSQNLAGFTTGGWRFVPPLEGFSVYVKAEAQSACYHAGAWEIGVVRGSSLVIGGVQVVGSRTSAIASPSGGTTVDSEGRAAIDQILSALHQHGLIAT